MKLVIGAAQLGMNYGVFNSKKINPKDLRKIQRLVLKSNINFIDTASSYGDSEKVIGNSKLRNLNVITKIKIPKKNIHIKSWLNKEISKSLNKLKIKKIYGVLVHNSKDLLGKYGQEYLRYLLELKKKKIIKKIGISIYNSNEIKKIWKFWKPDLVQVPFNPLDTRILDSGWIDNLKKFKIKVYARSIFLQGILINHHIPFKINKKFKQPLYKFNNWCYLNKISNIEACIHFAKQFKKIDYLVVGFNSYLQLKKIIDIFEKKYIAVPKIFSSKNLNLIDPRKWNLKTKF
jgi:aryl-alcohol dehydrogenase-like predicted oxidoreductase